MSKKEPAKPTEKLAWTTVRKSVKDLTPAGYNPRLLTEKERADLRASIEEFGHVEPVAANLDGTIIGGHQRVSIYADLGVGEIDVRVPNRQLSPEEELRLNLRLNRNTGSWDWKALSKMDRALLEGIGFTGEEMKLNFGVNAAELTEVDMERMNILAVVPPESPNLKERVVIRFDDMKEYRRVKKAVEDGKITAETLMKLA